MLIRGMNMKQLVKLLTLALAASLLGGCANPEPTPVPEDEPSQGEQGGEQGGGEENVHTHTFSHEYGRPASFFDDGVLENDYCTGCQKHFDSEGNELTDISIPKLSSDLSLGVNGEIKADFVTDDSEIELNHLGWTISSLSLKKNDVISV